MNQYERVKGTRDFVSRDANLLYVIGERMCSVLRRYGCVRIKTPALETLDLLIARSGPAVVNQIFSFEDKAGRKLGLRFDNTVPAARIAAKNGAEFQKPFKFYYFDNYWRYEAPQQDRFREFFHVGVECFGSSHPLADADVISCFYDCFREVGLPKFHISINNRKILEGFLVKIGVPDGVVLNVIRIIDKRTNYAKHEFKESLVQNGFPANRFEELCSILDLRSKPSSIMERCAEHKGLSDSNRAREGLEELQTIFRLLENYQAIKACQVDFGLARGFDYYTGTIFECIYPNDYGIGSLGGGGRYDGLVGIYGGGLMPATGFSIGVDRTILALKKEGVVDPKDYDDKVDFFVSIMEDDLLEEGIRIVAQLRDAGYSVDLDLSCRKFKKQMQYADKTKAKHVIVVGKNEINQKYLSIVDFRTGNKYRTTLDSLISNAKHRGNCE
jgi:histidyl-tRNA synthetase